MPVSPYPDYVPLRTIVWGGASSIVTTRNLRIEAVTTADRVLVWAETMWRFVPTVESRPGPTGMEAVIEVPPTDLAGWITPDGVPVDPNLGPTHRYTTTVRVFDGAKVVEEFTVGPYRVPSGEEALDGDGLVGDGLAPSPVEAAFLWNLTGLPDFPPEALPGQWGIDFSDGMIRTYINEED